MNVDGLKLTSYFGERKRSGRRFLGDALMDVYGRQELTASIMLRGTEGFGRKHHLRSDHSLTRQVLRNLSAARALTAGRSDPEPPEQTEQPRRPRDVEPTDSRR